MHCSDLLQNSNTLGPYRCVMVGVTASQRGSKPWWGQEKDL